MFSAGQAAPIAPDFKPAISSTGANDSTLIVYSRRAPTFFLYLPGIGARFSSDVSVLSLREALAGEPRAAALEFAMTSTGRRKVGPAVLVEPRNMTLSEGALLTLHYQRPLPPGVTESDLSICGFTWKTSDERNPVPVLELKTAMIRNTREAELTASVYRTGWYGILGKVRDDTPPKVALQVHGPRFAARDRNYVSPSTEFSIVAEDPVRHGVTTGVRLIRWNGAEYSHPFHLGAGIQTVSYTAEDRAGNVAPQKLETFCVDATPPLVALTGFLGSYMAPGSDMMHHNDYRVAGNARIEVEAYDMESTASGIASVEYRLDSSTVWQTLEAGSPGERIGSPPSFRLPFSSGVHHVAVRGTDHVGNSSEPQSYTLHVLESPDADDSGTSGSGRSATVWNSY